MPPDGGALTRLGFAALLGALAVGGCVQQTVLENDVRTAIWKSRTLSTATDLSLAHAALSAQLVELEALYQRNRFDSRVQKLLFDGYSLMAHGFVELRQLEALAAGDSARATRERALRANAEARARYYLNQLDPPSVSLRRAERTQPHGLEAALAGAEQACQQHDHVAYEAELNRLLTTQPATAEQSLNVALTHALASAWLQPGVAARCGF